jgi:hypothetical protein
VNVTVHIGDETEAGRPIPLAEFREPLDRCFVVSAGEAEGNCCSVGDGGWTWLVPGAGAAREKAVDALEPAQPEHGSRSVRARLSART